MTMEKTKTRRTVVKPAEKTSPPARRSIIQLTVLDRVYAFPWYNSTVHLYRPEVPADAAALRVALAEALVQFYPAVGRYRLDPDGSVEIDCNDAGVPYTEVESDSAVDDLGELAPSLELSKLVPSIDHAKDISSYPIMVVQVTFFKCGGVALGVCMEHHAVDGASAFHLISAWSEIARGAGVSVPPFHDRTAVIRPRDPPRPKFDHPEYPRHGPNKKNSAAQITNVRVSILKLTNRQVDEVKQLASCSQNKYSTFEALAGHIWKCVCRVRKVSAEEETRLCFPVNARFNRLKPPLPRGFFGNASVRPVSIARAGDLVSEPLRFAASKVRETLARIDDEYLRSAIDHLALLPDLSAAEYGPRVFERPNFQITSWVGLGLSNADFGWGPPVYVGPGGIGYEKACIFSGCGGGLSVAVALEPDHLEMFEKSFYDFV